MPGNIVVAGLILFSSFGQEPGGRSSRIDGTWNGTFADSLQSGTIRLTLEVGAEGSVQGTYRTADATGRIRGTLKGRTYGFVLSKTLDECPATYVGNLTFENNRSSGSYSGTSCQGKHENGVLSLVRADPSEGVVSTQSDRPGTPHDVKRPPERVSNATVFWWFDEDGILKAGSEVMDIVITARAYDGVLEILRQYLGSKTTTYHPPTFPLAEWVDKQMTPETLGSLLYWGDEVLDDTTPTMHFYMTKRAYQKTTEIVDGHFAKLQTTAAPQKKSKGARFLEGLRAATQGALAGAAYYYAVVQPRNYSNQQTWDLQRLDQQLNQIQWQLYTQNLQQQQRQERAEWNQWVRTLERYRTGRWP